ncbi:MAG: hypothetical protein RRY29_01510, partial [Desulfovibrionaceae bacterium]
MMTAPETWSAQWPEALECSRLDDAVTGQAYEAVSPAQRACIKTGIAFHYALHGEQPEQWEQRICNRAQGFAHTVRRRAAAWTLLFMEPEYAAGPRLIAALMPAVLARVPMVGVVCVGGLPSAAASASLELLGIEDIFCLADHAAAQQALRHMSQRKGSEGRALFVHKGALGALEA